MKRLLFPFILFFLLISEGIALDLLPSMLTSTEILIVPHWVLVFLTLVTLFYDRNDTFYAIIYGIAFGILIDVVYTGILGVYMFVYPFTLYVVHLLKRFFQTNMVMTLFIVSIGVAISELLLLFIFSIVGIVDMTVSHFIVNRLLPTLLANILFLVPLYVIATNVLIRWGNEQLEK